MSGIRDAASIPDFRELARRRLPRLLFDYIDGGSYAEVTLARNVADFEALQLRQRVMRDMSALMLETDLLGERLSMPVVLGPVGFAGMYARRGEVQAARAAKAESIPFCLSTVGICSVDEVAATGSSLWFQLYMIRDRGHMRDLLARAEAAGVRVLVFTVDLPTPGARYRDLRSGMMGAPGLRTSLRQAWDGLRHPRWLLDVYLRGRPHGFGNLPTRLSGGSFAESWLWIRENFDLSVTWADLDFVRANWSGRIIVKGILDAEDAREGVRAGVDALVVSNHGGRQLDAVPSTVAAFPAIRDAVGPDFPLLIDGGVRSGLDVLKALALGAHAIMLGRAWAFALAAGGEPGVARMLDILRAELGTAMVLTGLRRVADADRALLA